MEIINPVRGAPVAATAGGTISSKLKPGNAWLTGLVIAAASSLSLPAANIPVPNGSFESPVTQSVDITIDAWQKTAKPDGYVETEGQYWVQLTGLFQNPAPGDPRRILNCEGDQAIWLFAVPGVGLYQESTPRDPGDPDASGRFDAVFEPGKGYRLTVGVIGGGYGMLPGASLAISLYYRNAVGDQIFVGATNIIHDPALFGEVRELVDFTAHVPIVDAADPWAGQHLGIALLSTVGPGLEGGLWELDNVRLAEFSAPRLVDMVAEEEQFSFGVESEVGLVFEILSAPEVTLPIGQWISLGTVTNLSGRAEFTSSTTDAADRFYRAQLLP